MKIGVFGSYNNTSIGDHAILEGILDGFENRIENTSFVIFSFSPDETESMLRERKARIKVLDARPPKISSKRKRARPPIPSEIHAAPKKKGQKLLPLWLRSQLRIAQSDLKIMSERPFWRSVQQEIRDLDILLIGGGNLMMDMFSAWPVYPFIYAFLARRAKTPTMFFAVGAGPLQSRRGRWYFRKAARWAEALSFRDSPSLELIEKELGCKKNKLTLSADPAVLLKPPSTTIPRQASKPLRIGMTLTPYFGSKYWPTSNPAIYHRYLQNMAAIIERTLAIFDANVMLFATNHPSDLYPARDVMALLPDIERITIIEDRLNVADIISLLKSFDLFVGTRLHSLILAWIANTPSLALAYQPKVSSFYHRAEMDSYAFEFTPEKEIPVSLALSRLQELHAHKDEIQRQMQRTMKHLRKEAMKSIDLAIEIVNAQRKK